MLLLETSCLKSQILVQRDLFKGFWQKPETQQSKQKGRKTLTAQTFTLPIELTKSFLPFRITGLQIAEHFAQPNLVANCSRVELVCSLTSTADAVVSWAFHGENAAKLPSAHVQRDYADARWRLIIDCATIRHAGKLFGWTLTSSRLVRSNFIWWQLQANWSIIIWCDSFTPKQQINRILSFLKEPTCA